MHCGKGLISGNIKNDGRDKDNQKMDKTGNGVFRTANKSPHHVSGKGLSICDKSFVLMSTRHEGVLRDFEPTW
jgi:hypothetical protein